ncbi:hypothetical protein KR018_002017, partial [Drosophila ironensis]
AGKGWLVIQRRVDVEENFYRNWTSYEDGFGDLRKNFFIGLKRLSAITGSQLHELYIHMETFGGKSAYAYYDLFNVGNEFTNYKLAQLGNYSGSAGDSLSVHLNQQFSTYDRDND